MKKISTLYKKNPKNLGLVINEVNPDNEWVFISAIPTIKYDGTSCAIINGELYKRFDLKGNRVLPPNAIPCQPPDMITGHHPHWVKCDRDKSDDKYHFEAFDGLAEKTDGTYELCGEKVQRNPEGIQGHQLLRHGSEILDISDFSFESLKSFLEKKDIEGIVFHDPTSDRMCKIKKSNFGLKR